MSEITKGRKTLMAALLTAAVFACGRPVLAPLDLNYPAKPMELPRDLAAHKWAQMEWW